jgi:hypothetical protein
MPRWAAMLVGALVLGAGFVMVLFGAVFTCWDVHMRPGSDSPALRMLIGGVLLLLSRALLLLKLVAQRLGSPSSQ